MSKKNQIFFFFYRRPNTYFLFFFFSSFIFFFEQNTKVVLLPVLSHAVVPCGHGENGPMEDWVMVHYLDLIIVVVELLMLVKQKEQPERAQV